MPMPKEPEDRPLILPPKAPAPPPPAKPDERVAPGILRTPDGRLKTDLPSLKASDVLDMSVVEQAAKGLLGLPVAHSGIKITKASIAGFDFTAPMHFGIDLASGPDQKSTPIPFGGYDPKFCRGSNPENPQTEEDDDLPDGLTRDAGGTLRFTCRSCGHREAEWFGTPAEFETDDIYYRVCGGSPMCLP